MNKKLKTNYLENIFTQSFSKTLIITLLLITSSLSSNAQEKIPSKNLLIAFYNVENLFDTLDDPHKSDNEFLPDSKKQWDTKKYNDKIEKTSLVLSSINPKKTPDLIGLCEIENKAVVEDICNSKNLKKGNYTVIHYESPDVRSIDVALVLKSKEFKIIYSKPLHIGLPDDNRFKTRDILYVKLYHKKSKDTLHVFVNHWPSRRGGEEGSKHKRVAAAQVLKHITDSLITYCNNPKIIIMGDLNDEPSNVSVKDVLKAIPNDSIASDSNLYNLCFEAHKNGSGSYYYSGDKEWNMIDNMIVSGYLLNSPKGLKCQNNKVNIFRPDWILFKNKDGSMTPSKTYGRSYFGGYSDHLSIYIYLVYNDKKN